MIYFITAREVGRVKIGSSGAPWKRLAKMQSDSPVLLTLEGMIDGGKAEEAEWHHRFAADRALGEWFTLSLDLEAILASLKTPERAPRETPVADLCATVGISPSYASMILSGRQNPSRPLAIHIFRKTGWRHSSIADLTTDQIDTLEAVEPWAPRPTPTEQQEAA